MNDLVLTLILLLTGFLGLLLGSLIVRRRRTPLDLRPIESYRLLPQLIDEAIESNRPPHFSLGSAAVGQATTLTALASTDVMYYLVNRLSFSQRVPLVTLSDPITMAVAGDTLRRAYAARNNVQVYDTTAVAWFPQSDRSLTFAAGASNLALNSGSLSHVLLGSFGTEMAFFGELAMRHEQRMIAHSTQLQGQAVAFAMADSALIGEELFVGGAYLNRPDALREGSLVALDVLRWLVIVFGILLGILVNAVQR